DAVPLDDDVDRAYGRRAGAVDERRAANDQPVERPLALARLAVRGEGGRVIRDRAEGQRDKRKKDDDSPYRKTPLTRPELALSGAEGATLSPLTRGEGQRCEEFPFSPLAGRRCPKGG